MFLVWPGFDDGDICEAAVSTLLGISYILFTIPLSTKEFQSHRPISDIIPMLQTWNSGGGLFSDANKWKAKKVPASNDVVVVSASSDAEVKVSKMYVIDRKSKHSDGRSTEIVSIKKQINKKQKQITNNNKNTNRQP